MVEYWLFGKGPSLDTFDQRLAGPERIGINEAALIVADCKYAICLDQPIFDLYEQQLPADVCLLRCKSRGGDWRHSNELTWEVNDFDRKLQVGTASIALHLIAKLSPLGNNKVHFIGFDSLHDAESLGYAEKIKKIGATTANRDDTYARINTCLIRLISLYEIDAEFH